MPAWACVTVCSHGSSATTSLRPCRASPLATFYPARARSSSASSLPSSCQGIASTICSWPSAVATPAFSARSTIFPAKWKTVTSCASGASSATSPTWWWRKRRCKKRRITPNGSSSLPALWLWDSTATAACTPSTARPRTSPAICVPISNERIGSRSWPLPSFFPR